jgi:alpha-beta hydrolase superfamily lysophospholipase
MQTKKRRLVKRLGWSFVTAFGMMNLMAAFHAWKFTHFEPSAVSAIKPEQLSVAEKMSTIAFGVKLPRPTNNAVPTQAFETVNIQSHEMLEAWQLSTENPKGTVLIFHGYGGNKSMMIGQSDEFLKMGYNTLLVDFQGAGGSGGNQTTIGYKEADDVKACFDYVKNQGEKNIVLFGTSMGAAAVMKAVHDFDLKASSVIIECPFGTMYEATCARFRAMGAPVFPMARLLVFWGGLENGFWAFSHNPIEYAKGIHCPTLLLYGEQDQRVKRSEIDAVFENLPAAKTLKTYPNAGHENYLIQYRDEWVSDVSAFLATTQTPPD